MKVSYHLLKTPKSTLWSFIYTKSWYCIYLGVFIHQDPNFNNFSGCHTK
jgi:hypothetical protein